MLFRLPARAPSGLRLGWQSTRGKASTIHQSTAPELANGTDDLRISCRRSCWKTDRAWFLLLFASSACLILKQLCTTCPAGSPPDKASELSLHELHQRSLPRHAFTCPLPSQLPK